MAPFRNTHLPSSFPFFSFLHQFKVVLLGCLAPASLNTFHVFPIKRHVLLTKRATRGLNELHASFKESPECQGFLVVSWWKQWFQENTRTSAEQKGAAETKRADLHHSCSVLQPQRGKRGCKSNRSAEKPPSGEVPAYSENTEAQAK